MRVSRSGTADLVRSGRSSLREGPVTTEASTRGAPQGRREAVSRVGLWGTGGLAGAGAPGGQNPVSACPRRCGSGRIDAETVRRERVAVLVEFLVELFEGSKRRMKAVQRLVGARIGRREADRIAGAAPHGKAMQIRDRRRHESEQRQRELRDPEKAAWPLQSALP